MSFLESKGKEILTLESTMSFGQYKGESVSYVLENDIEYLQWVWKNVGWLEFDIDLEERVVNATFNDYLEEETDSDVMNFCGLWNEFD